MSRAQNVNHFAIECDDVERAKAFYERVFGWTIKPWGPPNYYHIATGTPERPGILGDLLKEFDFSRPPRPPLILPLRPRPGPASSPGGGR